MLSTQAIFLLAATMFGGVAQVEAGGMIDLSAGYTLAQNAGPSPEGQVPGPNAAPAQDSTKPSASTKPIQPVPGAMPDSDDVPSTISEKNARDDQLPLAAFRTRNLTDEQRQAIYRSVTANVQKNQPLATSIGTPVDVGDGTAAELAAQSTARRGDKPDPRGKGPAIRIQRRQAVIGRSFLPPGAGRHPVAVLLMKAATTANSAGR